MKMTGAQIVVNCLQEQQVETIFAYPGGYVLPLFDELFLQEGIRCILPTHEQGGSHAADGYARASGKVGVCIATSGPGTTNLVTGIATAYMDSVPVVFITGNVPSQTIGKDGFQEVDAIGITMPITKANWQVKKVADLAEVMRKAFEVAASGRPGPVLIDITRDVFVSSCTYTSLAKKEIVKMSKKDWLSKNQQSLDQALAMINAAQKPFLLAGGGVVRANAQTQLRNFVEKIGIPASNTLMGMGSVAYDSPYYIGNLGMHGKRWANIIVQECDLFIVVGSRLSDRIFSVPNQFNPGAKVLHIDIDRAEVNKNLPVHHHLIGDAEVILTILAKQVDAKDHSQWLSYIRTLQNSMTTTDASAMDPATILHTLHNIVGDDTLIATDVGQHQMWVAQHYPFSRPRQLLTSGGLGTMGYGLGAAIGAQLAEPDKRVVLVTGDGSFRMNMNELAVVRHYGLPIIIVILNNGVLGMVRQWQTLFFNQHYSCSVLDRGPDFVKFAQAFDIKGVRVDNMADYEKAIKQAFESGEASVIEVLIDQDEMVRPMLAPNQTNDNFLLN